MTALWTKLFFHFSSSQWQLLEVSISFSFCTLGLPRLRNFVNVYTNSRNRNDSVYTQLPYWFLFHYSSSVKSPIFFLKKSSLKNVPCANIRNCLVRRWDRTHFKLFQPDCNMRRLINNRHFFSVSSLVNSSKCIIGWHAGDVSANCHVGQNEIDINTHTDRK